MRMMAWLVAGLLGGLGAVSTQAQELLWPQNRSVFLCDEAIEVAVSGLVADRPVALRLAPVDKSAGEPVELAVAGEGTQVLVLAPHSLAPGRYRVLLAGQAAGELLVNQAVPNSPLGLSQTIGARQFAEAGGNFINGNAFTFGLTDGEKPDQKLRGRLSRGMQGPLHGIETGVPYAIYMYYTGYVLHKPWGSKKSWAEASMGENMRLFNYHVAQRLRRYDRIISWVGTIDEPGLNWGRTPAGGMASGFPNWDTAPWYEARGWDFRTDIANQSDEEWLKFMRIRCGILGDRLAQAAKDLKEVWPSVVFSSDLYAPGAIMDGTDPWNQRANDVPSTHVFVDWGYGKLGTIGAMYVEKCHDPKARMAHAMNGQLFDERVAPPAASHAYRLMLNALIASGLHSNWWLNWRPLKPADLNAVNEPGQRLGGLFAGLRPEARVALLWSFHELARRQQPMAARESTKKTGEQIKLMVSELPENAMGDQLELNVNAYSIGREYRHGVIAAHQALIRAGYPTHVLHDRLVAAGGLEDYDALVITQLTHEPPRDVLAAIAAFQARGGKVIVDADTKVEFAHATRIDFGFDGWGMKWGALFGPTGADLQKKEGEPLAFGTRRQASYFRSNHFMDSFARDATAPTKAALAAAKVPVVADFGDDPWLAAEYHAAGDTELIMVLNGYEELPETGPDQALPLYNHAPHEAAYTLRFPGDKARTVYVIEGADWRQVRRAEGPRLPPETDAKLTLTEKGQFAPGEMKLYVGLPGRITMFSVTGAARQGRLEYEVAVVGPRGEMGAVVPVEIRVTDPHGQQKYHLYRATSAKDGRLAESLPLGRNAAPGTWSVEAATPFEGLKARAEVVVPVLAPAAQPVTSSTRIFDEETIRRFLADRPALTIPVGAGTDRAFAEALAGRLREKGLQVTVKPEGEVWRKALYPRVFDPELQIAKLVDKGKPPPAEPTARYTIESPYYDSPTITDIAGEPVAKFNLRQAEGTLLTVGGQGWIDTSATEKFLEPGVQVFVGKGGRYQLLNATWVHEPAKPELRAKWQRPWLRLSSYNGAHNLVPQLPEAYACDDHLVLLGTSESSELLAALQASELLLQVADGQYPGPGKALLSFAWSPFALGRNVIVIGAGQPDGLEAGSKTLLRLCP